MESSQFKKSRAYFGRHHSETRQYVNPQAPSVHRSVQPRILLLRALRFFSNQRFSRGCRNLARAHGVEDALARKRLDYARGIADEQQIVVSSWERGSGERSDA